MSFSLKNTCKPSQIYIIHQFAFAVWCREVTVDNWTLLLRRAEEIQRVPVPNAATVPNPSQQTQHSSSELGPVSAEGDKPTEAQENHQIEHIQEEGLAQRVQRPQRPQRLLGQRQLPAPEKAPISTGQRAKSLDDAGHHHVGFHILLVAILRFGSGATVSARSGSHPPFPVELVPVAGIREQPPQSDHIRHAQQRLQKAVPGDTLFQVLKPEPHDEGGVLS